MASCPAFFSASRPPYTFASFNAFLLTRAVVYAAAVIRPLALFVPLTGPWPTLGVLHVPRLSHPQRLPLLYVVCVRPFVARFYTLCAFVLWLHAHRSRVFFRFYTLVASAAFLAFIRCVRSSFCCTLLYVVSPAWRLARCSRFGVWRARYSFICCTCSVCASPRSCPSLLRCRCALLLVVVEGA